MNTLYITLLSSYLLPIIQSKRFFKNGRIFYRITRHLHSLKLQKNANDILHRFSQSFKLSCTYIHDGEMWPLLNIIEKPSQALFFFMQTFIDMSNKSCNCTRFACTYLDLNLWNASQRYNYLLSYAWCYLESSILI